MPRHGQPLILTEESCSYHLMFKSILYQPQVRPGSIRSISRLEVIKKFVGHNRGFGFLPRATVEAEVEPGKLSVLAWTGPAFSVISQRLYYKDKWISPALKAFIAFAIERMRLRTKRRRNLEQAVEICVVASKTIKQKLGQKRQEGDGLPWMARRKLPVLDKIDQNKARIDSLRPMQGPLIKQIRDCLT